MTEQYAVDSWGYNEPYDEEYEDYAPPTNVAHTYSKTVQDLDADDQHDRRYSAVDFDATQYGYDMFNDGNPIERPDTHYAEHAARQKIAELATIARRHENLLKQQQQAIDEENKRTETAIYQKVERPRNRKQWVKGTHVLVQRDKSTQWFHGTIVNIYYNAMGEEVITVLYYEFKGGVKYKTVRRYDKNVKAPNEDAWELFKKEEGKNMTLYQKLFTGVKGDNTLYDQIDDIDNEQKDTMDGDAVMIDDGNDGEIKDNEENEDDEDKDDGDKKKKKKKKKKRKKKKKGKKGERDDEEEDEDGNDKKKKKKKRKKHKKDKKKKKKDKKSDEEIDEEHEEDEDDDDGHDNDDDKKKKKKRDKNKKNKK